MTRTYRLDELKFYVVDLVLHGIVWFSSLSQPHPHGYIQTLFPVIHNYPLTLAFAGQIVEESYVSKYNEYKDARNPAQRFDELRIYAYPLTIKKPFYKKILLSMSETDYLFYKPQTRLVVPILTHYNALAPGTEGRTVVITTEDFQLPRYVRIGAKRYGIWKLWRVTKVHPVIRQGVMEPSIPFNVLDVRSEDLITYSTSLSHYAGDIALTGRVKRALEFRIDSEEIEWGAIPSFIS